MGLSSALNTSLTGMSLSSTEINVLGNNVANAGTTGFKQSNVAFATQLSRTLSLGTTPTSVDAGTNPRQYGYGGVVAGITPDFTQGSVASGKSPSNLAIQGNGFFVVNDSLGSGQLYTRDGTFSLDSAGQLTTSTGQQVLGYGVDSNFNIVPGALTPLQIPLGTLQQSQQTTTMQVAGALSPQGQIATHGTLQTSAPLTDQTTSGPAGAGTLLTNLLEPSSATPTTPLFAAGQTITFAPSKGGPTMAAKSLTVTSASTVSDLETFISNTLGLQTGGAIPVDADGIPVGVSINAGGQIVVKGNRGTANDFSLPVGSMTVSGSPVPISFVPAANPADGENATTTFTIYDSTGTPINVRMSSYLESQSQSGTVYRYLLESPDQSGPAIAIGNGTITFDSQGNISSAPTAQFTINRSGTAAANPMQVTLDISQVSGLTLPGSNLHLTNQDGAPLGSLTSYNITDKGVISGTFDNGLVRNLGQVALAQFTNSQGLVQVGDNNFAQGIDSGLPTVTVAGASGAGTLRAGALEQSNADIGKNLVNLINATAMFQENARSISSNEQLFNVLLSLRK